MKKNNSFLDRLFMALVFVFLYAPIVLLIVFSFNSGNSNMVWKGFSLHWYTKLFRNRIIMQSVYTTLLVSLLATIIATVAGTFAAIGFYAMRRRVRNPLMTVNNIPMMNADIVTGVSMCLLFVAFFSGWGSFASWFNTLGLFRLSALSAHSMRLTTELPKPLIRFFSAVRLCRSRRLKISVHIFQMRSMSTFTDRLKSPVTAHTIFSTTTATMQTVFR